MNLTRGARFAFIRRPDGACPLLFQAGQSMARLSDTGSHDATTPKEKAECN